MCSRAVWPGCDANANGSETANEHLVHVSYGLMEILELQRSENWSRMEGEMGHILSREFEKGLLVLPTTNPLATGRIV